MSTYDNEPWERDGWAPPPAKHCGEICAIGQLECRVCGDWLPGKPLPERFVLGEN